MTAPHETVGCPRVILCVVAFCCGAALLTQEVLAAGWMAPLFGNGIDVWSAILSVTMAAMAAGYFLGSRRAERLAGLYPLLWLLCIAGVGIIGGAMFVRTRLVASPELLTTGWLVGTAGALLAVPVICLAAVSPWMVQLYSAGNRVSAGRAAGVVSAAGTVGGIAGAMISGTWAVPRLGLWLTCLGSVWIIVVAMGFCAIGIGRSRRPGWLIPILILAVVTASTHLWRAGTARGSTPSGRLLLRQDTWYGRKEVTETGVTRQLLVNGMPQSTLVIYGRFEPTPETLLRHGIPIGILPFLKPGPNRALVIGLGGGLTTECLLGSGWTVDCAEIDPDMVAIARQYFHFTGACAIADGRKFLNRSSGTYDVIVLDAYSGENLVPHLCTREFFLEVRNRLPVAGLLVMPLIGPVEGKDTRAVFHTVNAAFPYMAAFVDGHGGPVEHITLIASLSELPIESARAEAGRRRIPFPSQIRLRATDLERAPVLTDDLNPLPLLRRETARAWRASRLRSFQPQMNAVPR